jgi:hypothetical protein
MPLILHWIHDGRRTVGRINHLLYSFLTLINDLVLKNRQQELSISWSSASTQVINEHFVACINA